MLDHVKPVSFDYKPGYGAPGRNYGVLAQDLEKSPMGASLITHDKNGLKQVDVGKTAMANMASNADMHQRLLILEGKAVDKDAQKRERAETPTPEPMPPPSPPDAGLVTSDEVVKDDIRREGIDPQEAYASRVNELRAMAQQGHPEAPRKLEHLEREGSKEGLSMPADKGNLLGTPDNRPTVARQLVNKAWDATIGRPDAKPEQGTQEYNISHPDEASSMYGSEPLQPPFERTQAESTGTPDEVPPPKTTGPAGKGFDTTAEPSGPPDRPAPTSTTIAAHYQDSIGPEAWAALSQAERDAFESADRITNRGVGQAQQDSSTATSLKGEAEARGALALHDQRMAERNHKDLDAQSRDMLADARNLANYHEDPNHFWESRSTGQRMAGLIGVILGGFAQGMHGGPNAALDQLNRAQDKDIDAQRAKYNANKDSLVAKRSAYGMAMERFNHDDTKATMALRLSMLDKRDAMAQQTAAQHAGTDTMDRLDKFLADTSKLRADQIISYKKYIQAQTVQHGMSADTLEKLWQKHYAEVTAKGEPPGERAAWIHGILGGQVPASGWGASADRQAAAVEKKTEADQKRTIIVDGKPRLAVNDGVVKEWNDYSHSADEARRLLKVMLSTKDGDPAVYDAARAKMIEVLPQVYGYARGPSIAQVQHTFGPEAIPEYAHWYTPRLSSRADRKLLDLEKTLETVDKSTREHTLGQSASPTIAPNGGAADLATPGFKGTK